jgi:hypothetical protein
MKKKAILNSLSSLGYYTLSVERDELQIKRDLNELIDWRIKNRAGEIRSGITKAKTQAHSAKELEAIAIEIRKEGRQRFSCLPR